MVSKTRKLMAAWFCSVFLVFAAVTGAQAYSGILAFGDSLSDNGYYEGYPGGTAGNTNPADFYGFRSFSAGPVWVDYLASDLGVSAMLNMAYGGATSGWDNPAAYAATADSKYLTQTGLQWQVAAYGSVFGSVADETLITMSAGGNDNFNSRPADTAAQNVALAISTLYALGGRDFLVLNLPATNDWQTNFSLLLYAQLSILNSLFDDINLYILDWNQVDLTGLALDNIMMPDGIHPTTDHQRRIANIAWTAVPEPASILLMLLGFAGLAGLRRKMK